MAELVYLAEIDSADSVPWSLLPYASWSVWTRPFGQASATGVLRRASATYVSKPADSPANTAWPQGIRQPLNVSRQLFAPGATAGRSRTSAGDIEIVNPVAVDGEPGALDYLIERRLRRSEA